MSSGFVNVKSHVLSNVFNHHKKFDFPIMKFLDRKPVFCTVWSQSLDASTDGVGWQDVNSPLGETSPLRFIKFNDAVLFGLDQMNTESEMDETRGLKIGRNGDMLVLPDTIQFKASDFITFHHENHSMVYRVMKVDNVLVKNRDFSKISFNQFNAVDAGSIDQLNKQTIAEYTMIYENYGGDYKTIVKTDRVNTLKKLQLARDRINKAYTDTFYDKYVQTLICRNGYADDDIENTSKRALYSPDIVEFIKRSESVFYKGYSKLLLEHESMMGRRFSSKFDKSDLNTLLVTGRLKYGLKNILSIKFDYHVFDSRVRPFSVLARSSPDEEVCILNIIDGDTDSEFKDCVPIEISINCDDILNCETDDEVIVDKLFNFEVKDLLEHMFLTPLILRKIDEIVADINGKPLYKYDDIHSSK
ncbi:MAG: hypothetical protein ACRCZ9_12040 [Fusobacteriaceae bacterium]